VVTCVQAQVKDDKTTVQVSSNFVGGQATYSCAHGLELIGNVDRICLDNGEWSGQVPYCRCEFNLDFLLHFFSIDFSLSISAYHLASVYFYPLSSTVTYPLISCKFFSIDLSFFSSILNFRRLLSHSAWLFSIFNLTRFLPLKKFEKFH